MKQPPLNVIAMHLRPKADYEEYEPEKPKITLRLRVFGFIRSLLMLIAFLAISFAVFKAIIQ